MINLNNLNVVLTGATGIIGSAILDKLHLCNSKIIATGTNQEKLNKIKQKYQNVTIKNFDISKHSSIEKFKYAQDQFSERHGKYKISLIPNDDNDLYDLLGKASVLYIPMDFSKKSVRSIRLSYLTKQPLYMSLGVPLIVHGPETIHVVEHAQAHGYADVVTDPSLDALVQSILNHINDYEKFIEQTNFGLAYAKENHCIEKVQKSLYKRLLQT